MRLALMLLAMLVLVACTEEIALETLEPQEIYVLAENDLEEGRLKDAGDTFAEVERLYPYSNWAKLDKALRGGAAQIILRSAIIRIRRH
ncbi:MAG: hypothetical protein AAFQ36_04350, partial [Pseudomonadota bacterium]